MEGERIRVWDDKVLDLAVFCDEEAAWAEDSDGTTQDVPRAFIDRFLKLEALEDEARKMIDEWTNNGDASLGFVIRLLLVNAALERLK